jgi:putative transposase
MRVKAVDFASGQYYHIYNHAVPEQSLFRDENDYLACLKLFKRYYNAIDYSILAYCLMPNHYHILIYQKTETPISASFRKLWYCYTCYYNQKYKRRGTLFASKLQHIPIIKQSYLLRLCAYIHLNPLKARLIEHIEDWKWSNYPEWIGVRNGILIDREQIKLFFKTVDEYKECITTLMPEKIDHSYRIDG